MLKIVRGLMADGILNGASNEKWYASNHNQILRNENTSAMGFLMESEI